MTDHQQLIALTKHLGGLVEKPAPGKHGDYVSHANINQVALWVAGPHDFEIVAEIRGTAPEIKQTDKTKGWPARENAIVGCKATLRAWIDAAAVIVTEVGSVENPAVEHDGENLKKAASDAYKRCWMRVGLGLHLWVASERNYFLHKQLQKDTPPAGVDDATGEISEPEVERAIADLAAVTVGQQTKAEADPTLYADDDPERPF